MKLRMLVVMVVLVPIAAHAEGYAAGCFKRVNALAIGGLPEALRANYVRICTCQERELRKRGISHKELEAFVREAGNTKRIEPDTAKVAPKINDIIHSEEVKRACGSLFE